MLSFNLSFHFSGQITSRHIILTEAEFHNIVAEWLRFARQRKDDKAKENINNE